MRDSFFTDEEILDIARDNKLLSIKDLAAASGVPEMLVASLLRKEGGFDHLLESWTKQNRKDREQRVAKYRADNPELIRKLESKAVWSEFAKDLLSIINAGGSLTTTQIQSVMGKQS